MDGEDQGASGHDPGDDWRDEGDGGGMRGWIPPDDRLWRHPSESMVGGAAPPARAAAPDRAGGRDRSAPWVVGGATVCVIVALVAVGLVMATTNGADQNGAGTMPRLASLTDVPTTEVGVGQVASAAAVASMMGGIRPSLVALVVNSPTGTSFATGLVVESGGMIVTSSDAVPGSRSVTVVEPDGTSAPATKVGFDPPSGLSVLRIADDLPAANFDFAGPSTGSVAMALALLPDHRTGGAPTPKLYAGTVVSAGVALDLDRVSTTFAAIGVEVPLTPSDVGCPLLDRGGQVVGILERSGGQGLSSASTFLPAELVWGVAEQLVASSTVETGWIGVTSANAVLPGASPTPVGALIDSVDPGGPAAIGGIEPGDVVTSVDGYRVRSAAEFKTRVYVDPPGTDVAVTLDRAGTTETRRLVVGHADPDAPEASSSP
ncbi:MAG TPA: trypsin-like peptidase domain-containing protein [Acidimicrobiales bacterium]